MFKFKSIPPNTDILNIGALPNYAPLFFFKNIKGYAGKFIGLTFISVLSTLLGFGATWLLSFIISNINIITSENILLAFLPIYLVLVLSDQFCGYYTRKYGEMLPVVYTNHLKLRFYNTYLRYYSSQFINYSKEKLLTFTDKYCSYVTHFLNDWNWQFPRHITRLCIILGILWYQSPLVLLVNLVFMVGFFILALYFSKAFIKPVRKYHEADNEAENIRQNFMLNINAAKKLQRNKFFIALYQQYLQVTNEQMVPVRKVHSLRWLLQMNLFNLVFIGTFFYAIYQVVQGQLPIGFILLIQYAFNNLLGILIYFVEYHAIMVNQKQDNLLFKKEIESLGLLQHEDPELLGKVSDHYMQLKDVCVSFKAEDGTQKNIIFPNFEFRPGDKIAITGESGVGKSTLFNLLLGQVSGIYDSKTDNPLRPRPLLLGRLNFAYVNSTDPLFNISILDNICLEKTLRVNGAWHPNSDLFKEIWNGLGIDTFIAWDNKESIVGSKYLNLSTGQIQRIKIARALYQDAEVYLLDEPFNGIDEETKAKVKGFMDKKLASKTVIFITHEAPPQGYIHYEFIGNTLNKK